MFNVSRPQPLRTSSRASARLRARDRHSNAASTHESATEEQLKRKKLQLEIADLQRSPWLKPAVFIPIAATLVTLAISQYLGVFNVQRERIQVENEKALILKRELEQDTEKLRNDRASLEQTKQRLNAEIDESRARLIIALEKADAARRSAKSAYHMTRMAAQQSTMLAMEPCGRVGTPPQLGIEEWLHDTTPTSVPTDRLPTDRDVELCIARLFFMEHPEISLRPEDIEAIRRMAEFVGREMTTEIKKLKATIDRARSRSAGQAIKAREIHVALDKYKKIRQVLLTHMNGIEWPEEGSASGSSTRQ